MTCTIILIRHDNHTDAHKSMRHLMKTGSHLGIVPDVFVVAPTTRRKDWLVCITH